MQNRIVLSFVSNNATFQRYPHQVAFYGKQLQIENHYRNYFYMAMNLLIAKKINCVVI